MSETMATKVTKPKTYLINEVFYSPQGEGIQAGVPMVFVRFSKCNMACDVEPSDKSLGGFACDTEFESGRRVTLMELVEWIQETLPPKRGADRWPSWLLLTGGEPGLQVDKEFCEFWHVQGWKLAIETNGSVLLPYDGGLDSGGSDTHWLERFSYLDWITVSPKVAEHAIKQKWAHEVKYVRGYGQSLPETVVGAKYKLISPATTGLEFDRKTVEWCVDLVKANPSWRLTAQLHKLWEVR